MPAFHWIDRQRRPSNFRANSPHAVLEFAMQTEAQYQVRPWQVSDAPSLLMAVRASLQELMRWMPWCTADYALQDALAWIDFSRTAWRERSEFPLGVIDCQSGQVVGGTGINQINSAHRIGNIGYWVSSVHVRRGIARYAAREAAKLGFDELGLHRLEIVVLPENTASQRVAESLGAWREGIARHRLFMQGRSHDAIVYSLTPEDLERD